MILAFLDFTGPHRSKEGFVGAASLMQEMQNWGFTPAATEAALRRANNKKLIETSQRVTFDEGDGGLFGDIPGNFRLTTIGAYHLKRWMVEFSYLDAMAYDTPILDHSTRSAILPKIHSFQIEDRLERAILFKEYLSRSWHGSSLHPQYFDWSALVCLGEQSFERVSRAVTRTIPNVRI
jgi:hypothetical protein